MENHSTQVSVDASNWTGHQIHDRIISSCSKEEKIALYGAWASDYEKYCKDTGYEGPAIAYKRFYPYIASTRTLSSGEPLRLLDCGCGTGRLTDHMKQVPADHQSPLYIIGIDYCNEMLEESRKKGTYQLLLNVDLSQKFTLPGGQVDLIVAAGLFLDGQCGPEIMPNIFQHLKKGGYAVVSVRHASFVSSEREYLNWIEKCDCDILENNVMPYIRGEVDANYLILRKRL